MIRLGLIRHGHTDWNRSGRIQGRTDVPLDQAARIELSAKELPPPWDQTALYSSPLSRAVETARLIADREPLTVPELIEMDWGKWEGQRGLDLRGDPDSGFRDIEDWGWGFRPPAGESPSEVWQRLHPWLNSLKTDGVAICHIGTMRVILAKAYGWDFNGPAPFQIKRNRLYVVELENENLTARPEQIRLAEAVQ